MAILANITGAAADLLTEALVMDRYGVELGGIWDTGVARELEAEGLGTVKLECETHGHAAASSAICRDRCDAADLHSVFVIGQAGVNWLVDAGRTAD